MPNKKLTTSFLLVLAIFMAQSMFLPAKAAWFDAGWDYRIKITIASSEVDSDLTDFPIYVNLDDLPDSFFTNVQSDGDDIRVTESDGTTEVPVDIVWINTGSKTGEIHFKADGTLSSSTDTDFYIYYGNNLASRPAVTAGNGRNAVWSNSFVTVLHLQEDGNSDPDGYVDSTGNGYDGTGTSMTTSSDVSGQMGQASDFDGSADYISFDDFSGEFSTDATMTVWLKKPCDNCGTGTDTGFMKIGSHTTYSDHYTWVTNAYTAVFRDDRVGGIGLTSRTSWHHLAITNAAGAGNYKVYHNAGSAEYSNTGESPANISTSPAIGLSTANRYFEGQMDEFRLASATRSQAWLDAEYSNQNASTGFYTLDSEEEQEDTTKPSPVSFVPTDNGIGAGLTANLSITFDDTMDIGSGNFVIKKMSDDSVFETIDITSAKVTGNGTTTITFNPANGMDLSTSYYVEIDNGALFDDANNDYDGFTGNGAWNFTTVEWFDDNWTNRVAVTVNGDFIASNLSNFPVYVDLSLLPDAFFDDVKSDGGDIRVTTFDGITEVAREVVSISTTANTGEMHFVANGTLTASTDQLFYIYYNNAAASEPAEDATYGSENVWVNGYIGVWHGEEDPDLSDMMDSTSNDNDGVPQNISGVTPATCKLGLCHDYDGVGGQNSGDNFEKADNASLDIAGGYVSISAWLNADSINNSMAVIARRGADSNYALRTEYGDTSSPAPLEFFHYNGGWEQIKTSSSVLTTGSWQFVAVSTDGTSANTNFYHNTTEYAGVVDTGTGTKTLVAGTAPLRIGMDDYAGVTPYGIDGKMDEVRLSNVQRNADWFSAVYNNQNNPAGFLKLSSPAVESGGGDTSAPEVVSFNPTDDSVGVAISSNLSILFDEAIDIANGDIFIKKLSDNSLIETINSDSNQVTGNGATTIYIDPSLDFAENTSYYVEIESTSFDDLAGNSYAGIVSNNGTWNFTTVSTLSSQGWSNNVSVTILSSAINSNLENFPVYINLDDLPDSFFSAVKSDGSDIRITQSDKATELPFELVSIDTGAKTGELWFKADNLSSSTDTVFYLFYGKASATAYTEDDTYGAQNTWSQGFEAVYHLEDNDNIDSTANDSNGSGAVTRVAGQLGMAPSFNGSQEINMPGNSGLAVGTGDLTYDVWIKTSTYNTSGGMYRRVLMFDGPTGNAVGNPQLILNTSAGEAYAWSTSGDLADIGSTVVADDNWHLVHITREGSSTKIYVDGSLDSTSTWSSNVSPNSGSPRLRLAKYTGISGRYVGIMDNVKISSEARSADWVYAEYLNQNGNTSDFYSIVDDSDPLVTSFSPADDSINISLTSNLSIQFDRTVETQSGNIIIKKLSDNSTYETIDVSSNKVTGNGTSSISIDPVNGFSASTSYYVTIANTAFDDESGNSYAGFSDNGTWNFSTTGWIDDAWTKRIKISAESEKVSANLSNMPVYYDLSLLPGSFFDDVKSDGSDIRVTSSDGETILAREVVTIDTTNNAGELHFLAPSLSSTSNSDFYLYYGNSAATAPAVSDANGRNAVWTDYKAVWHMQDDVGTATDSTGNNHTATAQNMEAADKKDAKLGKAYEYDNTNEYLTFGSHSDFDAGTGDFHISAWVKPTTTNTDYIFRTCLGSNYFYFMTYGDSFYGRVDNIQLDGASNNITTGIWQYGTFQRESGTSKIYYNDSLSNSTSMVSEDTGNCSGEIGSQSGSYTFHGLIDELRFARTAKSSDWIATEYNNQNDASTFWDTSAVEEVIDNSAPTVTSYTPADNALDVSLTDNLSLVFDDVIDIQVGNIDIYENGNGLFESIDVTSNQVTGNGTNTIYIDPSNSLNASELYYVRIDSTAFDDDAANDYAGIADNGAWNFRSFRPFTDRGWSEKQKITILSSAINGDLSNFPVYVDLSDLDDSFFSTVNGQGADIRIMTGDQSAELAFDLVDIDTTANTGELWFKADSLSSVSDTSFWIAYGNGDAVAYAEDDSYGAENVWTNGYVGVWHMDDDPDGAVIYDATSYDNDATPVNMTGEDPVVGQLGNALDFDGSNEYTTINDDTSFSGLSALTTSAWVNVDNYSQRVKIMAKGSDVGSNRSLFEYEMTVNTAQTARSITSDGTDIGFTTSTTTTAADTWFYAVGTYDGTTTKFYLDGDLEASDTNISGALHDESGPLQFARNHNAGASEDELDGTLDEIHISNVARSADWINAEYLNQNGDTSDFYSVGEQNSAAGNSFFWGGF